MRIFLAGLGVALVGAIVMSQTVVAADAKDAAKDGKSATPLAQDMKTLDGKPVNLAEKYKGKVVLLVNVASKCGLTPQYKQLEALHEKYADKGLAIVGVPCNQFGGQEPGTADDIAQFCEKNYGVKFDLLSKVDVNGDNACPLYKSLTAAETKPEPAGKISWNFEKFVIGRDGQIVARFKPKTTPDSPEVVQAIEAELAKK